MLQREAVCLFRVPAREALVGGTDEDGPPEDPQGLQFFQDLPVLLRRLGKAQARIQDPVRDARPLRLPGELREKGRQGRQDAVRIRGLRIHRTRIAPFVHRHVSQAQAPDRFQHVGVVLAGGDVVHPEGAGGGENPADDFRAGGIHRKGDAAVPGTHHGREAAPFLPQAHIRGARARGHGAQVDQVRPGVQQQTDPVRRLAGTDPARSEKGIRGQVDDSHDLCHSTKISKTPKNAEDCLYL